MRWSRLPRWARWCLIGAFAASGCSTTPPTGRDGRALYEQACATCHGKDGIADPAWKARLGVPDLADAERLGALDDEAIRRVIAEGSKNGKMPPWKQTLSPAQIDAVAAYVRTLSAPARK
jgi:cytochrome c oxidase cbb3-type subunit 3